MTHHSPEFFTFHYQSSDVTWGSFSIGMEEGAICPGCNSREILYGAAGSGRINEGSTWADIVGNGGAGLLPFIVSERFVRALESAGPPGFEPRPVVIREIRASKLRRTEPPQYYCLQVTGKIEVDVEASGIKNIGVCEVCKRIQREPGGKYHHLEPRPETWDGSLLLRTKNVAPPVSSVLCTRKVIELARQERWINFRFDPMDAPRYHTNGRSEVWNGVDYLGKQWPPERWYPPPTSEGKSLPEWLEHLRTSHAVSEAAYRAPLDFGEEALPALLQMVGDASLSPRARYHAGHALRRFEWELGTRLPPGTNELIEKALSIGPPGPPGF